jgi:hypothetical protein
MGTEIVEGNDISLLIAENDDGLGINRVKEKVPRFGNLVGVSGKQPTPSPNLRQLSLIDQLILIKRTRKTVARAIHF